MTKYLLKLDEDLHLKIKKKAKDEKITMDVLISKASNHYFRDFIFEADDKLYLEMKERARREAMPLDLFIRNAVHRYLEYFLDKDLENLVEKKGLEGIKEGLKKLEK